MPCCGAASAYRAQSNRGQRRAGIGHIRRGLREIDIEGKKKSRQTSASCLGLVVPAFVGLGGLFRCWLGSFFALGGLLAFLLSVGVHTP